MDAIYPSGKQAFLSNTVNWLTSPIVCVLVGTQNYNYNSVHASLADIPVAARIATSGTLFSRTAIGGVADAADVNFGSVTGNIVNAVVIYNNTGTAISSTLIAYLDQAAGFPLNPNGGPIAIEWSNGSNRIFTL